MAITCENRGNNKLIDMSTETKKPTPTEALEVIRQAVAHPSLTLNLQQHALVQTAVGVIAELVPASEPACVQG